MSIPQVMQHPTGRAHEESTAGHGMGRDDGRELLRPSTLARLLGVSVTFVFERVTEGKIPHFRIGNRIYFHRSELIRAGWLSA